MRSYYRVLPCPFRPHEFGRGCAGWLGSRTACPAGACGSWALHSPRRRRWQRRPQAMRVHPRIRARPSNCSESPKASGTVLGWRHPWTPCCSMGVTIRWLWGVKQPSRLTCSATDRNGASYPAGAVPPCQGPQPVTGCAHVVRMWALPSGAPARPSAPWESGSSGRFRD